MIGYSEPMFEAVAGKHRPTQAGSRDIPDADGKWIEEHVAMASRHFCPNCDAVPRPSALFCSACGAPVEHRPPHVALMLLAYLACAPVAAWVTAIFMSSLETGTTFPTPEEGAQIDAADRTGAGVAIIVTVVGAAVLLIPLARRTLGVRTIGRALLMLDGAVAAGMAVGFAVSW